MIGPLALCLASCAVSGCLEYEIASPERPVVLARNSGLSVQQINTNLVAPRIVHRQYGLRVPWGPISFVPLLPPWTGAAWSVNQHDFHLTVQEPLHNVVLVGEHRPIDFLYSLITLTAVSSSTVTVFDHVE